MRSWTAICSVRMRRSAPATGMRRASSAATMAGRERRALAHQDQDVAGAHGPSLGRQALARFQPPLDGVGNPSRQPGHGMCGAGLVSSAHAGVASAGAGLLEGQISSTPAWPKRWATWATGVLGPLTPGVRVGAAKILIDRAEQWFDRAEGERQGICRQLRPASRAAAANAEPASASMVGAAP
mgnify:CR=1 FL=1